MKKVAIIGLGSFGCAMYSALNKDLCNISLFFHSQQSYDFAVENKRSQKRPNCSFDNQNTTLTNNLEDAITYADFIFLVCNFSSAVSVIKQIKEITLKVNSNKKPCFVLCCKGLLEKKDGYFLNIFIQNELKNVDVVAISGGSFADELVDGKYTGLTFASKNEEKIDELSKLFNDNVKIEKTNQIEAVEFFGAVKNVMAIYVGFVAGSGSVNASVLAIVDFLRDIKTAFEKIGFDSNSILSYAGLGDIILTCMSTKSRNRTFGGLLAKDKNEAVEYAKNTTVEGLSSLKNLHDFFDDNKISCQSLDILFKNCSSFGIL